MTPPRSGAAHDSATTTPRPRALPAQWRELGEQLASVGAIADPKKLLELCAQQLEQGLAAAENEILTLAQAAEESGMHPDTLRHLIDDGKIPQAGRKGAPRIRRGDLPRKPGKTAASAYDPHADAMRLLGDRRAS